MSGISGSLLTRLDAVLRGCLPGQPERLAALDAAIRAPLPLSTGVGVIGAGRSAPTGVVAHLLTEVLAARRPHRVVGVGAQQARPAEGFRHAQPAVGAPAANGFRQAQPTVGAQPASGVHQAQPAEGVPAAGGFRPQPAADHARRATARTGEEATAGLERAASGAWRLGLNSPGSWWEAVAPISRFFDFVVTDWGTPATLDNARAASTVLLVVAAADRTGLQAGVDLRARLAGSGLVALLAVHDTGAAPRGMAEAATVNGAMWLPADRGLDHRGGDLDQQGGEPGGFDKLSQRGGDLDKLDQRNRELAQRSRGFDQCGGGLDKLDQRDRALHTVDRKGRLLRYSTTVAALELTASVVDAAAAQNHSVTQSHSVSQYQREGAA